MRQATFAVGILRHSLRPGYRRGYDCCVLPPVPPTLDGIYKADPPRCPKLALMAALKNLDAVESKKNFEQQLEGISIR